MMDDEHVKGARIYCARGCNKWGLGFSVHQALDACRPYEDEVFYVVMLPKHARMPYVDSMGSVVWTGPIEHCEKIGEFKHVRIGPEDDDEHRFVVDASDAFDWEEVE